MSLWELPTLRAPSRLYDRHGPLLYRGTLAQLSADAGSFKSFLAVDAACSVAAGIHTNRGKPENVIYVAAEGAAGLYVRILAWCEANGIDLNVVAEHLTIIRGAVQLHTPQSDVIELRGLAVDLQAALVVLDTRSKCTLGTDESSPSEQAVVAAAAESIVDTSGAAVLVIHHNGKDGKARGGTLWPAAVWSDLRATADKAKRKIAVTCAKHKDAADGCLHPIGLVEHVVSEHLVDRSPRETDDDYLERRRTLAVIGAVNHSHQRDSAEQDHVEKVVDKLDALGLPRNAGRPTAERLLAQRGIKVKTQVLADAIRLRKARPHHPDELFPGTVPDDCSGNSSGNREQVGNSSPTPQVAHVPDAREQLGTATCSPSPSPLGGGEQVDGAGTAQDTRQEDHVDASTDHEHVNTTESGMAPVSGSSRPEGKRSSEEEPPGDDVEVLAAVRSGVRQGAQPGQLDQEPTVTPAPSGPGNEAAAGTVPPSGSTNPGGREHELPDTGAYDDPRRGPEADQRAWDMVHRAQWTPDATALAFRVDRTELDAMLTRAEERTPA